MKKKRTVPVEYQPYIETIKSLRFPQNAFMVVGGGTLSVLNLRATEDIDIFTQSEEVWALALEMGKLAPGIITGEVVEIEKNGFIIEVFRELPGHNNPEEWQKIIQNAQNFDDVLFMDLKDFIVWKNGLLSEKRRPFVKRQKDLNDINLALNFLALQESD
jgi:hypothetical protein